MGKTLDKIQHPFIDKKSQNLGIEETYLNIITVISDNLIAKTTLSTSEVRNKRSMPFLALVIQHSMGHPSQTSQIKDSQIRRQEIKLFADDVILYRKS